MLKISRQNFDKFISNRGQNYPDADDESRFRHFSVFCAVGVPIMLGFSLSNLLTAHYLLATLICFCAVILTASCRLLYLCFPSANIYRINCFLYFLLLILLAFIGGEDGSKTLWMYIFPLAALFLLGNKEGALWIILLFVCSQFILWNPFRLNIIYNYSSEFVIRFSLSYSCVALTGYFYEHFRYTSRTVIETQNALLNKEINDRRKVEKALRRSEEKYRAIYSQAAEGIVITSLDGVILESNPQMNNMLGYPSDELNGLNILDLIHPKDFEHKPQQLSTLNSGETIFLERRLRTAIGSYLPFELSGRRIENDKLLFLYRDITDRKAAEIAMEKANEELDRLANLDGLTSIANRRKFEKTLRSEWQRMSREKLPLTLIICDIDYFKQYNDLYGHQEGDSCLITIARTLNHSLKRPADLAARFGGEEFVILLPNTPSEGGFAIAEAIRSSIMTLRIQHKGSKCSPYITMSFGVTTVTIYDNVLPDDLIAVADKALYRAKHLGRNKVVTGKIMAQ